MRMRDYYPGPRQSARWYPSDMVIAPPTAGDYIFVDGNLSTGGSGTSWEDAFATIQAAVDAASRGDIIMVAPKATDGNYGENVVIGGGSGATSDEYGLCGLHVMGVTNAVKNVRVRAAAASTKYPYTSLAGVSILGASFLVCCTGIEISNLCIDASGVYTGIYWGDGSRPLSYTGQSDAMNGRVHDCSFKYGTNGIDYDGASSDQHCHNNYFYKQSDVAVYIGEGGLQHSKRIHVYDNLIMGAEDYGVFVYSHAECEDHLIARNIIKDQKTDTTEVTNPVLAAEATKTNAVVGNWCACDNDISVGAKSYTAGNFDGNKAGGGTYVRET